MNIKIGKRKDNCVKSRFPDPEQAPVDAPGAMGGALSTDWLLDAYACGYFPWFSEGEPILWWCPDPRFVLEPSALCISKSLAKELAKDWWRVTFDQSFERVIESCAMNRRKNQSGTWIVKDMVAAYYALYEQGYAHSVECWRDDTLVGGLYGVSLGGLFFGESMFYRLPNASKIAFVCLVRQLDTWQFTLIDCQQPTDYLASFGAVAWPRSRFLQALARGLECQTRRGRWNWEASDQGDAKNIE